MERGKKLAAMAKKVRKEAVNTSLTATKQHKIEKSFANDENNWSAQNIAHVNGSVLKQLPCETITSFDVGISDDMLPLLKKQRTEVSKEAKSLENMEDDEDVFHETDFDDSDYIPSEDSDLDTTSESIRNMAAVLESKLTETDLPQASEEQLVDMPITSKRLNKLNKNLGKEYYTYRNKKIPAKKFETIGHCKKMCHKKISPEQQEDIFKKYWNLGDYNKRRLYILNMIDIQNKKSETFVKALNCRNRQYVYLYHLEIHGQRYRVCKKCFLKVFGETDSSIKTINRHKINQLFGGLIPGDGRGKHEPAHKLPIHKHNEVIEHINSIPKYESHYSRRHTTQLYFQRGFNLATLYRLYTEKYSDPVSESKYYEIFRPMNIKFKKPQLDLCNTCETLKSKIADASDEEEKIHLKLKQKEHHDNADFAYECKKNDKELALNNSNVKMFSFDLQQCLPTPYLRASMFFYKRPLWTFNLTVHDGATKKAQCYLWNETIAKRGANDIGSCLFKCLLDLPSTVRQVILYSDSCPGQNRNSYICAMFLQVFEEHTSIEVIDHKFLVVGHTHLECDTVHAQIEKKKKNSSFAIYYTHDWANLISATNNKYVVHELNQKDFFDFNALMKDKYTWRTCNISGEKFEWKQVRWMRYEKSKPGVLQYKSSLHPEEDFKQLDISPRRSKVPTPKLVASYTSSLSISQNKKRDLLDMLPLISTHLHSFYRSIKAEGERSFEIDPDFSEEEI